MHRTNLLRMFILRYLTETWCTMVNEIYALRRYNDDIITDVLLIWETIADS